MKPHRCDEAASEQACPCGHDHAPAERGGLLGALAPVLACAICPACVSTYAKALAVLGVGITLTARQHAALLVVALSLSIGVSARRAWQARRAWPVIVALAGATLVCFGHFGSERPLLEWFGIAVLLAGGLVERHRARRARVGAASRFSWSRS
jgi:hypothetical protein